ncbi:YgfZ/GcvT domain-containing protein [Leucothrix arctica]|uniref:Folate-binding protein n=1 Tax=Leucothrix arctica TaxID=1481894 RepID=A0A317CBE6_9GAMM|nr:folate-binding protein YgfZ [Leucothrix arctica]PWQ93680.1 folate-binding protein [Leucothrix arctica]
MKSAWKAFLIDQGAEFEEERLVSFGNPNRERRIAPQGAVLSNLADRGLLEVSGADAESFLQNQLTNDITKIDDKTHQLTAWCSPKGRVIANFRAFKRGQSIFLIMSRDMVETVMTKLSRYIMMSKVSISDATDSLVHFGYAGENAQSDLELILDKVPTEPNQTMSVGQLTILRLPGNTPRFEVFGDVAEASALWVKCNVRAAPVSSQAWDYINILAGRPVITAESTEVWIPQMINLTDIDGVDFQKGCYPGQEVVARLHYLGKNKRRMFNVEITTHDVPKANDSIVLEDGTEVGKILNAVINPDDNVQALVILKIADSEKPLFLAQGETLAAIKVLTLPYTVNDDS